VAEVCALLSAVLPVECRRMYVITLVMLVAQCRMSRHVHRRSRPTVAARVCIDVTNRVSCA